MSFYQPSLSLYDVLNALAGQAQAPDRNAMFLQEQQEQQQRAQLEARARAQVQSYAQLHAPGGARRRYPTHEPDTGVPASYYYGAASNPHYYRPLYYYTGEDDSDDNDDLESDETVPQYTKTPFYYHSRVPNYVPESSIEGNDLQKLLSNLFGFAAPASSEAANVPKSENEAPEARQSTIERASDPQEKAAVENSKNATSNPEKKEDAGRDVQDASAAETEPRHGITPLSSAKKHSFLHQQVRSPVPDPLQVSKPETRLDLPFSPEVNVYDCADAYILVAALPGATSKDFRVDYHPSSHELIIRGDVEDKLDVGEKSLKINELKYGAFQRTLKFPVLPRIKDEEIKATYKNGLLQVKVPKLIDGSEKPAPKKRIVIEDIPDEELEFEEDPNPVQE